MRKFTICLLLLFSLATLFGQGTEDWLWGEDEEDKKEQENKIEDPDFIRVNYQKKDARRAMVYSMLLPGAGQFYADKSSITTYIFPVLEIGMIAGILVFSNRGDKKTDDYEYFANGELIEYAFGDTMITTHRYERDRQHRVESIIMGLNSIDIYESSYFRLDGDNTQHFYEDIGKYPHYVYGWADWYYHFATDNLGNEVDPIWYPDGYENNPGWVWSGNYPIYNDDALGYSTGIPIENNSHASSAMRKEYVALRNKAKDEYAISRGFTYGLVVNHLVSGFDAIRLARKANKGVLSDSGLRFNYYAAMRESKLTPTLEINWKF
ncbi:MAG: hypothetical protein PHY21_04930 [Candidatus Cloacimonetes bacterium]|nr:hypothetical protein [Candidatus Cloacimonadota bacterium]HPF09172.1 hypothetical protein [Candidatus Cloacimonadota bacterium]